MDGSVHQLKTDPNELANNVNQSSTIQAQFDKQDGIRIPSSSQDYQLQKCNNNGRFVNTTQRYIDNRAYLSTTYDVHKEIANFWISVKDKIDSLDHATLREANRHQELPLARIKKIMKLDDDVKHQMISAEAPVLLAKAAEMFIEEITLRSWLHTEESKRKTLQKCDISQAVSRYEQFDFLIDIVPRDDNKRPNQTGANISTNCIEGELIDDKVYAATASNPSAPLQFILQVANPDGSSPAAINTGSLLQATQIGQPIQLNSTNSNQPIQLIALGLTDGNIQQFQLQLPPAS